MGRRLRELARRVGREPRGSTAWGTFFVLVGLTGFAVSQPLLAVLGEEPTWFTFRRAGRSEIILFALVVTAVPPVLLWGVGRLLRKASRPVAWRFHLLVVAALVALAVVPMLKSAGLTVAPLQVLLAVAAAVGFAVAYARVEAVALWARYSAVVAPFAVGLFLFGSPTGDLARASASDAPSGSVHADTETPSVVMVVLDELPTISLLAEDGTIDAVRFPNLAAFAGESTWYRNYTASSPMTRAAVPSLLSGKEPDDEPPTRVNYPDNLFSLLAPTHRMFATETATALCDPAACETGGDEGSDGSMSVLGDLLADGADVWRDRVGLGDRAESDFADFAPELAEPDPEEVQAERRRRAADQGIDDPLLPTEHFLVRPEAFTDIADSIRSTEESTLWFLHLMLPHQPWLLYPDGRGYDDGTLPLAPLNDTGDWNVAVHEQRHLLQLQYTDALVGDLVDRLRDSGEYDDALVIITADHGASFLPGTDRRRPQEENLSRIAFVPLFVKEPGQTEGVVDESNAIDLDLVPTIADRLGIDVPWEVAGVPLGSPEQLARDAGKVMFEYGQGFVAPLVGTMPYDMLEHLPDPADRLVGPIGPGDGVIDGLLRNLAIDDQLGRSLEDLADGTADGVRASIDLGDGLRDPASVARQPGLVSGTTSGAEPDDILLVEVNGTIVSGSMLHGVPLRFDALLPPDALEPEGNEIRLALLRGDEVLLVE